MSASPRSEAPSNRVPPAAGPAARRAALRDVLRNANLDALLVSDPTNLRYLTGFTGSNGAALIAADGDDASAFLTDSRYDEQSAAEVPDLPRRIDRGLELAILAETSAAAIGFEAHLVSVARHRLLADAMPPGSRLIPQEGLVEQLRAVKDAGEIDALRQACTIADTALEELLQAGGLSVGRSERQAALDLDHRMRLLGAEDIAFATILAAGEHSAIPHHQPTDRPLRPGDLIKIDFGAQVAGYHSDMTRMFVLGPAAPWQQDLHALVLAANSAGRAAARAGAEIAAVDSAARDVIDSAGHGEHFGHGLGHGVGLQIHEEPFLASTAPGTLETDMTVTIEPGVYLPGRGGVRIEDTGVIRPDGYEPLTLASRELAQI